MSIPAESFQILVVDDDRLSRQVMSRFLKKEGYQVIEASNGQECLAMYKETRPNLILLDAMMPNMNGFECCTQLLKLPNSRNLPVIMVTGLDDQASVDWAFDAGATDFVTKPIHWPVLRRRVKNVLEKGYLYQELERLNQKLNELVTTDALTGLSNRRYFDEGLIREWQHSSRALSNLSLLLCDVDSFKAYNDTYGHQAGDLCLQKVSDVLKTKAARRATDIVARYGGEEFAAILPCTPLNGALEVAARFKQAIENLALPHQGAQGEKKVVTISVGVASMVPDRDIDPSELLLYADKALYHAKNKGRNTVAFYRNEELEVFSNQMSLATLE